MNIAVFEDSGASRFYPVSLTRPVWELRLGCYTLRERIERVCGKALDSEADDFYFFAREYCAPLYKERLGLRINDFSFADADGETMFINPRLIPAARSLNLEKNTVYAREGMPLISVVENRLVREWGLRHAGGIEDALGSGKTLPLRELDGDAIVIDYLWSLVSLNSRMIREDFSHMEKRNHAALHTVTFSGDVNLLYIENGVSVDPGAFIDLGGGPVIIREGTRVDSSSRIEGPCYIGKNCSIRGARLRSGCSLGDFCRIGGEVEESIVQGYSNKNHDGFIGHSYIGEWVNLGALTTNSDLKNNYATVKVYTPGGRIDTGQIKVGCFIGDFTRTSIGTLITTGGSIGAGCMLVHPGRFTPNHVPSFTWLENDMSEKERFDSFLQTCRVMTARRGVQFSDNYAGMMATVREITEADRKKEIKRWKKMLK